MNLLKTGRPSRKDKAIASVKESTEKTVRMNINIQKTLHKKIKQMALDQDKTVTEFVLKALDEYMSK